MFYCISGACYFRITMPVAIQGNLCKGKDFRSPIERIG